MPPTVVGLLPAKGAFTSEGIVAKWSDWVELWDAELTLGIMLRTIVCHVGVVIIRRDWALLWQVPFLLSTMHDRKGFHKSAEENLLHSRLGPEARTCILVTDGSIRINIGLFEVFL